MVVPKKNTGVWGMVLCSPAEMYLNFKGTCCCFHLQGRRALKMMTACSSKMSVNFYQTDCITSQKIDFFPITGSF
jgi:hypothetical protein